jgi:hypothetical protein
MKRQDLYILGLGIFQVFLYLHVMSIINAGAGISLMGEKDGIGYLVTVLFLAMFLVLFNNMYTLVSAIGVAEESALQTHVIRAARWSLVALLILTLLQFLQALSYLASY